jgi:hypothetical protein
VCKCDACKSPRESSRPFFLSNVTECTPAAASSEAGGMGGGWEGPVNKSLRNAKCKNNPMASGRRADSARCAA